MKRLILKAFLQTFAKAFSLAAIIGVVIGTIGYVNKWDSSITYSNAFFVAGCLVIIAGTASRLGSGQEWHSFQMFSAESFRGMDNVERVNFIVNTSNSMSAVILGVLSGLLLIIVSALAAYVF